MYVYLRKGETPIRNADVTAVVYSPQGERKCELSLLDNGAGKYTFKGKCVNSSPKLIKTTFEI